MKPKILMLGTSRATRGGITTVVNSYLSSGLQESCRIRYVATHREGSYGTKVLSAFWGYTNFAVSMILFRPHIIHIHAASRASFYRKVPFVLISRLLNKKIIYHHHGGGFMQFYSRESSPDQQTFIRWVLRKSDMLIVLSEQWKNNFMSIEEMLHITVLPNAVTCPQYSKRLSTRQTLNILFMGRVGKTKGIHDLIAAAKELDNRQLNFKIIVCGDGDINAWQDECNRKGIKDIVQFRGWVSGDEKTSLLREADIYVHPSYYEGLPMSLLEAISYGLPVVATSVGGIPEAVIDGVNGFLVKPGDVNSLAAKICNLLEDETLRRKFGIESRKLAEQKFDITISSNRLKELYLQLIQ